MSAARRWIGPASLATFCALVVFGERRWPLRRSREAFGRRAGRNALVAASAAAAAALCERPLVSRLSRLVEARRWGLRRLALPRSLETTAAVLLLDYTLFLWHVLTHRVPWLWRFHRVHHADLDLDATSALRFHFGEMALSAPYRALQVVAIGVSPRALALWQGLLLASITFHHANLRLPRALERRLARVVMTPRLHGRHHAPQREVRDCNWSSGLSLWDRLHGTFHDEERALAVGLAELSRPAAVTAGKLLVMPFARIRR